MTITLSPELSERVEKAAQARGTDGLTLAESLLDQILRDETSFGGTGAGTREPHENEPFTVQEDLFTVVTRANAELEAGGGVSFTDYAREQRAAIEARRLARASAAGGAG